VHRNQPFEFVASALGRLGGYAGYDFNFEIGPYDDSLSTAAASGADVEVYWLDFSRYKGTDLDLGDWLIARLQERRKATGASFLITDSPVPILAEQTHAALEAVVANVPGVRVCQLSGVAGPLGGAFWDERAAAITGTNISDQAALQMARRFAFEWLPAVLEPRIKAVAIDLDDTLYAGVLAEDGPAGLEMTPAHEALQAALVDLTNEGVLVSVVSRNEPEDVTRMFATRTDFPLRMSHIATVHASWRPKSQMIVEMAEALRIDPSAILYLDDNAGELAAAANAIAGIRCIGTADPRIAQAALRLFPALHGYPASTEDSLRQADVAALRTRESLSHAMTSDEYAASLGTRLTFHLDEPTHLDRMAELSRKTNQFNTGLRRFNVAEFATFSSDPSVRVITVELSDRLSISGVIAAIVVRAVGKTLQVDDIAISCRALGRGVEDVIVTESLDKAATVLAASEIAIPFTVGPRNQPALDWRKRYLAGSPTELLSVATVHDRRSVNPPHAHIDWSA
jgi:FkbH-like protein